MNTGWIYLLFSSLCSLTIVHFLKYSESKRLRTIPTLTVNYLTGGSFALFQTDYVILTGDQNSFYIIVLFFLVLGAIFITNFLIYSKSVHSNGMGISVTAMRLSLLVPVLISIFIYNEMLHFDKVVGLILVFTSLFLLFPRRQQIKFMKINAVWLLLILFLLSGLADASLKIYEEELSVQVDEYLFMGSVFFTAFFIGTVIAIFRPGPVLQIREMILGILIGLPNLYSSIFLVYALKEIDGAIAYPVVNIFNVIGGSLLGILIWNDKVSRAQWIGIFLALIAIILLL